MSSRLTGGRESGPKPETCLQAVPDDFKTCLSHLQTRGRLESPSLQTHHTHIALIFEEKCKKSKTTLQGAFFCMSNE
jgi:hypothetical protein